MAKHWDEQSIPDQSGKVALITGANSGIGWDTARALAEHGAHVVMACRTRSKATEAKARIDALKPRGQVSIVDLDLASLTSVHAAAEVVLAQHEQLHLLINNAGVMAMPHLRTAEGFEMQIGTNHLGHFAWTGLLLNRVMATLDSRVIVVASNAHKFGKMDFDDLLWEKSYKSWGAYGRSKLANLLFAYELQRRLEQAKSATIVVAAHPGGARTSLGTPSPGFGGKIATILRPAIMLAMQPAKMGALPTLRAAVDPAAKGGDYFGPDKFAESRGHPVKVTSNVRSRNPGDAERLWAASERLTGVTYHLGEANTPS